MYKIHIYFAYLYNNRESEKKGKRRNRLKLTPLNNDLINGPIREKQLAVFVTDLGLQFQRCWIHVFIKQNTAVSCISLFLMAKQSDVVFFYLWLISLMKMTPFILSSYKTILFCLHFLLSALM